MIDFIVGKLVEKNPTFVVLETNGIGYFIHISLNTYGKLGNLDENCKLFTHMAIRSEAATPVGISLYGFFSVDERELYVSLITVNGVGANTARLILSSLTTHEAITAIASGNAITFEKVKGIGSKTAQKIIIDLRSKYSKVSSIQDFLLPGHNTYKEEALSGLTMLGFSKNLAEKALDKLIKSEPDVKSVEDLIKMALKIL